MAEENLQDPDKKIEPSPEDIETLKAHRDKVLGEKKVWQAKAKELETKAAEAEQKLRDIETRELEGKGEIKKLLDLEREAKANLEKTVREKDDQLSRLADEEKTRKKFASVLQNFEGGLDKRWWGLIDLDSVLIDPDTGEVNKESVTKVVNTLKETYPEMVRTKLPGMPKGSNSQAGSTSILYSDWKALPHKEQNKWKNEQIILPK